MKNTKIHQEIITPQKEKTITKVVKPTISKKDKDFILKKMMRGENRKDKMFKGVNMTLEQAKNLFK